MCWFKKKEEYLYIVEWAYDSTTSITHREIVKAADAADAWLKIAKCHIAIDCRKIKKFEESERS